jgi:hypothetical protein
MPGIGREEALEFLQQVSDRGEEMRQAGEANPYMAAADKLADEWRERAMADRLGALQDVLGRAGPSDELAMAEQRLARASATPPVEFPRVEAPYRDSGARTDVAGLRRELRNVAKFVADPFEPRKPPASPNEIVGLHPEDRAEIEAATAAVEKADRLRGAYEAAAACLTGRL